MAKRLFDITFAFIVLAVTAPILLAASAGILLSDPGPVLYRARRIGKGGEVFWMYKFRSMRREPDPRTSTITAHRDRRVFFFGKILRLAKIDELPQFFNVLAGDMSVVGPRPEDPSIVERWYTPVQRESLSVRPGVASPGSIYNYTHGEKLIVGDDPERDYAEQVLPLKLALEIVYVRSASFAYDVQIIARTLVTIFAVMLGKRAFRDPPELKKARAWGLC